MKISVILCTYNRCESLTQALNSISEQKLPASLEWEVLVIDNNSKDDTRVVVDQFCQRNPARFRYIFEPRQGKSHALNTGIERAEGDVLAFTDDDVTFEPTWLQNLTASLAEGKWAGTGGRVIPQWPCQPPRWLLIEKRTTLAPLVVFDPGIGAGLLSEAPFGANMAFRKSVFEKYGGFRTDLGPCPGSMIRGEDSELADRLLASGEWLRYEPSAVVYHPVSEDRLEKKYHLQWWFDKGRGDIRAYGTRPSTKHRVCGVPLYMIRGLLWWSLRWMLTAKTDLRFERKTAVWNKAGAMLESYHQSGNAKTQQLEQRHQPGRLSNEKPL